MTDGKKSNNGGLRKYETLIDKGNGLHARGNYPALSCSRELWFWPHGGEITFNKEGSENGGRQEASWSLRILSHKSVRRRQHCQTCHSIRNLNSLWAKREAFGRAPGTGLRLLWAPLFWTHSLQVCSCLTCLVWWAPRKRTMKSSGEKKEHFHWYQQAVQSEPGLTVKNSALVQTNKGKCEHTVYFTSSRNITKCLKDMNIPVFKALWPWIKKKSQNVNKKCLPGNVRCNEAHIPCVVWNQTSTVRGSTKRSKNQI